MVVVPPNWRLSDVISSAPMPFLKPPSSGALRAARVNPMPWRVAVRGRCRAGSARAAAAPVEPRARPGAEAARARRGDGPRERRRPGQRDDEQDRGDGGEDELEVVLLHDVDRAQPRGPQARHGRRRQLRREDAVADADVARAHQVRDLGGIGLLVDEVVDVDVDQRPVLVLERQPRRQVPALGAVVEVVVGLLERVDVVHRRLAEDVGLLRLVDRPGRARDQPADGAVADRPLEGQHARHRVGEGRRGRGGRLGGDDRRLGCLLVCRTARHLLSEARAARRLAQGALGHTEGNGGRLLHRRLDGPAGPPRVRGAPRGPAHAAHAGDASRRVRGLLRPHRRARRALRAARAHRPHDGRDHVRRARRGRPPDPARARHAPPRARRAGRAGRALPGRHALRGRRPGAAAVDPRGDRRLEPARLRQVRAPAER